MSAPHPPNHPLKLPSLIVGALLAVLIIVIGAAVSSLLLLIVVAIALAAAIASIWAVARGRNPWWTRSWLDQPPGCDRAGGRNGPRR